MHIDMNPLSIVFHLTLFAIFSFKLWGLIKEHLFPYLSKEKREQKKQQVEILERDKLLTSTVKRIDNQVKHQKKMFVLLEKKVQRWHQFKCDSNADVEKEDKKLIAKNKKKRMMQERFLQESKLAASVMPLAFQNARDELKCAYQGSSGAEFLKQLIKKNCVVDKDR